MCQRCAENPELQAFLAEARGDLVIALAALRTIQTRAQEAGVPLNSSDILSTVRGYLYMHLILEETHDWEYAAEKAKEEVRRAEERREDSFSSFKQALLESGLAAQIMETEGMSVFSISLPEPEPEEETDEETDTVH